MKSTPNLLEHNVKGLLEDENTKFNDSNAESSNNAQNTTVEPEVVTATIVESSDTFENVIRLIEALAELAAILGDLIKDPKGYNAWEQKSILKQFGLKSYEISRFKNEESRVKEILRLQKETNKNFQPLESDKPETREEKAARKAEILRKAIEKKNRNARN